MQDLFKTILLNIILIIIHKVLIPVSSRSAIIFSEDILVIDLIIEKLDMQICNKI